MKILFLSVIFLFVSLCTVSAQDSGYVSTGEENSTESPLCGGTERWAVKVLTDPSASLVNYTPLPATVDSLSNIPTSPNANAPRIPGIEFQAYIVSCNIIIKRNESDNDYHIILQENGETMIGEVPDPVCAVASTSAHVDEFIAARNWVNTYIGVNPNYNVNIPPVQVTGVTFVDVPHGQANAAPNLIEIHPILDIHFTSGVGIDEAKAEAAFKVTVSPSVFSDFTHFLVTSKDQMSGKFRIEIFTQKGEKVRNMDIPDSNSNQIEYTFRRNGLPDGLYIYRLLDDDNIMYEGKIIAR